MWIDVPVCACVCINYIKPTSSVKQGKKSQQLVSEASTVQLNKHLIPKAHQETFNAIRTSHVTPKDGNTAECRIFLRQLRDAE